MVLRKGKGKRIDFAAPAARAALGSGAPSAPSRFYSEDQLVEQFAALGRQIQTLRRTRDLLVPRLPAGQVELKGIEP